jgi:hypothetical protein
MDLFLNSSLMKLPFIFYQHIIHRGVKHHNHNLIFKIVARNLDIAWISKKIVKKNMDNVKDSIKKNQQNLLSVSYWII